ncbi:MAG: gephyrin-like molybdotransferase Glp [Actinomycetota bacterium]
MIPLDEARGLVLDTCAPFEPSPVPVGEALGLVLAEDIDARESIPAFPNTAMDGFAVVAADTAEAPAELDIVGTIAAGDLGDLEVGPGQAARIMTGAPLPPGADAVVMVELTEATGDRVTVQAEVPVGNHVRGIGEDISEGQRVLDAGTVLGPGHLGVLSSLGATSVLAHRRPRVGVMSTGDELVDDGSPLARGQIRDSNRATLLALLAQDGFEPVDLGLGRDDPDELRSRIAAAASSCDAIVTSGGVSMGDFDFVKVVLDELGEMRWMQIAIKPAKPFAFGTVDGTPVFGLPGNPVSSMVSYELFGRTGIRRMAGHPDPQRRPVPAVAAEDLRRKPDGKTHFLRVVTERGDDGRLSVRSSGGQGSHMLHAMAVSDGLAVVPDGDGVAAGDRVDVLVLG